MTLPPLLVIAGGTRATASTRHRLWNYRPHLEAAGHSLQWIEYQGGRLTNPLHAAVVRVTFLDRLLRKPPEGAVILVQKVLPPGWVVRSWKRAGHRIVYDFDDALYARFVHGESERVAESRKRRFDRMLAAADHVIAGSPPLAEYAARAGRPVTVLYPSLNRERFRSLLPAFQRPPRGDALTLGWIGNDQSQVYLRDLAPTLLPLLRAWPTLRLLVCSSRRPTLPPEFDARLDFLPWSEESELEAVSRFDVAVSPLGAEEWSRARGGRVSVLLSLAGGVPVVASPGGGVDSLLADGEGVFFARTPEEWNDRLESLLADRELRVRLGKAARAAIDRNVWTDVQFPHWMAAVYGTSAAG